MKKNREAIEDILDKLDEVDDKVIAYKSDMMFQAEKNSVKMILTSGVIMFIAIILLIVVKFSR